MRIIHLSCVAPPDIGGIGRAAAKEVALLNEHGFDAHHVSLSTHAGFRLGNAGSIHALDHFVRDADIVHLHYPFYGTAGAVASLRRRGLIKKLVITLHMDATATGIKGLFFSLHRRFWQAKILSAADVLIVSSRDYARHSSYKKYAEFATELPFGTDERMYSPGRGERFRFGLAEDKPVAVFVGGMDQAHAFKGIEVLLKATARLADFQLLMVGEGDLRKNYMTMAGKLGIAGRCHFVGRLEDSDLPLAYRSADVFVLPSISAAEAFGIVVVEAQACGLPAIASDLPGVRTTLEANETGYLIPPGDDAALAKALAHFSGGKDAAMSERARQRVLEKYTWSQHLAKLMDVYAALIPKI